MECFLHGNLGQRSDTLFREDTFLVRREQLVGFKLNGECTVAKQLLHDLLLIYFAPATPNKPGVCHFGDGLAALILTTLLALCDSKIRRTLLFNHVTMLHEVAVEVRPPA